MRDRDASGRPILDARLAEYVAILAEARPGAFGHLRPDAILFVAGAARREARASVRPFRFAGGERTGAEGDKPDVTLDGRPILYEVCLRPRFFLAATPAERGRILAHELWHIAPAFDGSLAPDRRHLPGADPDPLEAALDAALDGFDAAETPLGPALAHVGELRLRAWTARPPSLWPRGGPPRRRYTEADLHAAIVTQR